MDYATTLNIDQQGRIIIPAKVRKALQLHTGDVLLLVLTANKPITKQNLLASLIQEIEKQPDDYFQRLHRAAIEMIGVNGR